jgi:glucan phosphoethanolaminetransferase (alkaline phosphatase superfamily)
MEKQSVSENNLLVFLILITTGLVIIAFVYLFRELTLPESELKIFGVSLFAMILLIGINVYFMYVIYRIFNNNTTSLEKLKSRIQTCCPFEDMSLSKGVPGDDKFCEGCFLCERGQCTVREAWKKTNSSIGE